MVVSVNETIGQQHLLKEAEVAKLLRVSVQLIRKWRATKEGPEFLRLGGKCVRYARTAIDEFIESHKKAGVSK